MRRRGYGRKEAFTLPELLTVSALLLVLAALLFPSWGRIWRIGTEQRDRLRALEERERIFQKLQEDWEHLALCLETEDEDLQVSEGTALVLARRRRDGKREYVLWQWNGDSAGARRLYRLRIEDYPEAPEALADTHVLQNTTYRSFRNLFPEPATSGPLPAGLLAEPLIFWQIRSVAEADPASGGGATSAENRLIFSALPAFFSWRAWARGDQGLPDGTRWLAVTLALLTPSLQKAWEALPPGDRKDFLQRYGLLGTKLLPLYPREGT